MNPDSMLKYRNANVCRDRSRGNCTYYRVTGMAGWSNKHVTPIVTVTNSPSTVSVHFFRAPETITIGPQTTTVPASEMISDVEETLENIKKQMNAVREIL